MRKGIRQSLGTEVDQLFNDNDMYRMLLDNKQATGRHTSESKGFQHKPLIRLRAKGSLITSSQLSILRNTQQKSFKKLSHERHGSLTKESDLRKYAPIPLFEIFLEHSFMSNQQNRILEHLCNVAPSIKAVLHTDLQEMCQYAGEQTTQMDPKMVFILFNSLSQLDKNIMEKIFTGEEPISNFKTKYLSQSMDIVSESVVSVIRYACTFDNKLGVFIEYFWRFWLILIDIALQWIDKSTSVYVDEQVASVKAEFQTLSNEKAILEEKLSALQKQYSTLEANYNRKCEQFNKELFSMQQEFTEYQTNVKEMSDLRQADSRMNNIGLRTLELEHMFKQYDRNLQQSRIGIQRDFKELGQIMVQRKQQIQQTYQINQSFLKCAKAVEEIPIGLLMTMNPFVLDYKPTNCEECPLGHLQEFLDHLAQIEDISLNIPAIYKDWVSNDIIKINGTVNYLLENEITSTRQLFNILFGLNCQFPISANGVAQVISIHKQIQEEQPMALEQNIDISQTWSSLQLILPEDIFITIRGNEQNYTYSGILLLVSEYYLQRDNKLWQQHQSLYFESGETEPIITQYIKIKQENSKALLSKVQVAEAFREIRLLQALHPQLFMKPKRSVIDKMQSAIRRVSLQRKTSSNASLSPVKRGSTLKNVKK